VWSLSEGLLYNGYRVCLSGVKRPWRGVNHPTPSGAEVKERVGLPHGLLLGVIYLLLLLLLLSSSSCGKPEWTRPHERLECTYIGNIKACIS
jgi:hypothetical protein